jgi:hypothetical protein
VKIVWIISEKELMLLRAELIPADIVTLSYLSLKEAGEFYRQIAQEKEFDWSEWYIWMLAKVSQKSIRWGMKELIVSATARESRAFNEAINKE